MKNTKIIKKLERANGRAVKTNYFLNIEIRELKSKLATYDNLEISYKKTFNSMIEENAVLKNVQIKLDKLIDNNRQTIIDKVTEGEEKDAKIEQKDAKIERLSSSFKMLKSDMNKAIAFISVITSKATVK